VAEADVILYDYLVNPRMLAGARHDAELVCLGRHGRGRLLTQDEIHDRMIAATRSGRTVVRLKGGDPAIFGRTAEEIAALDAAGVAYEIVPGVTAALAASSYAGIPLTHRDAASCVAFVTGRECSGKDGGPLEMARLAQFPGTLVFYMGVTSAREWAPALVADGKPADTPAAIIRHATLPRQSVTVTTLGELPAVIERQQTRPPAIVVVGEVVRDRAALDWFAARPLAGRTVLVTRPPHQADGLTRKLETLGACVVAQPAIEIGPPPNWQPVDAAIAELRSFAWIVFSSANGVDWFLSRLEERGLDGRALGGVRIAAIGPATAQALADRRLRADLQPAEYRAEALAAALAPAVAGERVLLIRASRGREVLAETLAASGADVRQVVAYESRDVDAADPDVAAALAAGDIDWVTVTSSAIARALVRLFGDDLRRTKLAAISPLTAGLLAEAGFAPEAVAMRYTVEGLVEAILAAERPPAGRV
jgi:uroporphyrinogen III methyltransferase/synthase